MAGDLDKLQGTWTIVAFEADGQRMPQATFGGSQITIKKNAFKTVSMGAAYKGTFGVD